MRFKQYYTLNYNIENFCSFVTYLCSTFSTSVVSCLTPTFDKCPPSISFSPLPISIKLTSSQDLELRLFLYLNPWEEFRQPVGVVCTCLTLFCWGRKQAGQRELRPAPPVWLQIHKALQESC